MTRFPSQELEKIIVRLPEGMRERLSEVAKANNRSVNAEVVARLEQGLFPPLANRLRSLLGQISGARGMSHITPSYIAEMIGEPRADTIESGFAGQESLTFAQLESIANLWGARSAWLKHGTGGMFPVERAPEFTARQAREFLESDSKKLSFVRSQSRNGELAVVVERNNWIFETYFTGIHLSNEIDIGGEFDNARFSNACRFLWVEDKTKLSSYLMSDEDFDQLIFGNMYPGLALSRASYSVWAEDWWDSGQFNRKNAEPLWDKYREFCVRIYACVESDQSLREERDAILKRQRATNMLP